MSADTSFLNDSVTEALVEGLAATISAQPDDSVEYLGQFLLKFVERKEAEMRAEEDGAKVEHEREAAQAAAAAREAAEAPARAAAEALTAQEAATRAELQTVKAVDRSVLERLCALVQHQTGATGVYIARKDPDLGGGAAEGEDEGEGDEEGPRFQLRYLAATEDHRFLMDKHPRSTSGVTFDAWKLPATEGDEDEEAGDEDEEDEEAAARAKAAKPPPELPIVHIRNVLRDPRVIFHRLPRLGSFVAVPLRYKSLDHDGCIPPPPEPAEDDGDGEGGNDDEEDGGEDGGDGKDEEGEDAAAGGAAAAEPEEKPVPPGVPVDVDVAVCFDTLGKDLRVVPKHIDDVKALAALLKEAFERVEQSEYEKEFRRSEAEPAAEEAAVAAMDAADGDAKASGADERARIIEEGGGEAAPEDVRQIADGVEAITVAMQRLAAAEDRLVFLARRRIGPSGEALRVLQTAMEVAKFSKEQTGDAFAADPTAWHWPTAMKLVETELLERMKTQVGTSPDPEGVSADAINAAIDGIDAETLKAAGASAIMAQVLDWLRGVATVLVGSAARKAREEEEAAAAAAAAAEGAAGADGEDAEDD